MSELRRQMQADLRIRNYAERTQAIYIARVSEMARYYNRSPADVSADEVREYLRYLKDERRVSRSAFVQVIAGLRFLYGFTLGRPEMVPKLPYPRSPGGVEQAGGGSVAEGDTEPEAPHGRVGAVRCGPADQ